MIDFISTLRRIMNMSAAETFNPATDSLEAISNALAAMGIGPSVGLSMFGVCDPAMAASQTVIVTNNLVGLVDDIFNDEFYMQVILNRSVPGAAPEGEIRRITNFVAATQTFTTDAFSANVEANDLVLILHETLISIEITGRGTFTLSDLVQPEDNTRTEGGNYFRGCMLMPIEGAARFQPRLIVAYTGAGGIFDLDPGNPFSVLPGLVDYIIIRNQTQFVPLADGGENRTPADVVGNKTDTAITAKDNVSSIIRYLKGLMDSKSRQLFSMDFWSDLREEVAVTGAQSTIALPSVTVANLPAGAVIVRAIALFKFRMVENTFAGANKLDAAAALPIQVDDGAATGYVTAIDFVDDAFTLAASIREGGDVIIGDNNIAARVDGNDTYPVRWLDAKADQNNLQFNDVQCGLRVWYLV